MIYLPGLKEWYGESIVMRSAEVYLTAPHAQSALDLLQVLIDNPVGLTESDMQMVDSLYQAITRRSPEMHPTEIWVLDRRHLERLHHIIAQREMYTWATRFR